MFNLQYSWVPVHVPAGGRYLFPSAVGTSTRVPWNEPAVYRWDVFDQVPRDLRKLYIGEAANLYTRVNQYRSPGPSQQTNKRIKADFQAQIDQGKRICLDVLRFEPFRFESIEITMVDLISQDARRILEHLFIFYYRKLGYTVLNA